MTNRLHLLVEQLERATERALASAEALGARAYVAPVPGEWAAAQVVHHLLSAERSIVAALRQALAADHSTLRLATLKNNLKSLVLRVVLRLPGIKVKMPPALKPPPAPETLTLSELRTEWQTVRRSLEQVLHEFPGTKLKHTVFRHPRVGWLTIGQTLTFILDHTLHHQQQLNRITKAVSSE